MQQRLIENCFISKINLIEKLVQDTSNKLTYLADFIFVSKILDKKFYPVKTTNLFKITNSHTRTTAIESFVY